MTLLRAANLRLTFGSRTLFDELTLTLDEGERVGLIGPNGSGKSTLMKILAGAIAPDRGELQLRRGATVEYLPQEPQFPEGATVASELSVARGPLREALDAHAALSARLAEAPDGEDHDKLLAELGALADRIEGLGGWDTEHEAKTLLDKLGVPDWDRPIAELSGGTRKRVAIARALLARPSLLLLDEPPNHLDADTVDWLEEALDAREGALLLVTHDRYFLDDLVDRIVEIQPGGGVVSYPGNYEAYLAQKIAADEEAKRQRHKRDRWIAQEVAWLRRGVEARRTKSKARIERAQKLMAEKGIAAPKKAALQLAAAPMLGDIVLEAEHASKRFGERTIFEDVTLQVRKGERLGIVGRNGVGKTTLLRVLLGELPPDAGTLVVGGRTKVAYYDQARASLDPEATVYEAASDGEDFVELGDRKVPLRDYLDDLLFPVPMQKMQVKALSGGERNRLLLARLFLQGANLLVLDEPTNDLDIVTLNILEGLLLDFPGSVLLVTHDRYFLDKVATSILALEGDGKVIRYPGNYETYSTLKAQSAARARTEAAAASPPGKAPPSPSARPPAPKEKKGLSYKEKKELEGMEAAIEEAEARKAEAEVLLADPSVYADASRVPALSAALEAATGEVDRLYARWQELQERAG